MNENKKITKMKELFIDKLCDNKYIIVWGQRYKVGRIQKRIFWAIHEGYYSCPMNWQKFKTIDGNLIGTNLFAEIINNEIPEMNYLYPYNTNFIKYEDKTYFLSEQLFCKVEYKDIFIISNDILNIMVRGITREQAEQAFSFAFDALYKTYADESDDKLSDEAKRIKEYLLHIIKN